MQNWPIHGTITGPIVMIGFGSIGRGTLPLIERHFHFDKSRFTVIDPVDKDRHLLDERGIAFIQKEVTRENFVDLLKPLLTNGPGQPFIVNLSVEVSSAAIMRLAHEVGALYIDTVCEPWPGFYDDPRLTQSQRSNYALRQEVLDQRDALGSGPTADLLLRRQSRHGLLVRQTGPAECRQGCRHHGAPSRRRARIGRGWRRASASRASISPSATPSAPRRRSRWASSSIPGRSKASSRKACNPPNSAGARMKSICRPKAAAMNTARIAPSICCGRARARACAPGRRRRGRSTASSSPTMNRSRSPII